MIFLWKWYNHWFYSQHLIVKGLIGWTFSTSWYDVGSSWNVCNILSLKTTNGSLNKALFALSQQLVLVYFSLNANDLRRVSCHFLCGFKSSVLSLCRLCLTLHPRLRGSRHAIRCLNQLWITDSFHCEGAAAAALLGVNEVSVHEQIQRTKKSKNKWHLFIIRL